MVPELVKIAAKRLKTRGQIVINVSSPDNLVAVQNQLEKADLQPEIRMINIARGQQQLDRVRFDALNPTFLVVGKRKQNV